MERLHTDEELKKIELKQIAIDAEKWPRKEVDAFFERQGLEQYKYSGGDQSNYIMQCLYKKGCYSDFGMFSYYREELTLPDALRWEELRKEEVELKNTEVEFKNLHQFVSESMAKIADVIRNVIDIIELREDFERNGLLDENCIDPSVLSKIVAEKLIGQAKSICQFNKENEALKQRIKELEGEVKDEDKRVDFGKEVLFDSTPCGTKAYIGNGHAAWGDEHKVLIAGDGYKWQLHEDYYSGQNAVSLIKID